MTKPPWDDGDQLPPIRRDKGTGMITLPNWVAVGQNAMQALAAGSAPNAFRVYFAALGWCDGTSVAHFKRGELMNLLGIASNRVQDAINAAVGYGLLEAGSTSTALKLSVDVVQKAARQRPVTVSDVGELPGKIAKTVEAYAAYVRPALPLSA